MSDDKNKTGSPDSKRISTTEPYEVKYWTKELGCSEKQLKDAIAKAGSTVATVKKQLEK